MIQNLSNFVQFGPKLRWFFKVGQNLVGQNWTKLDKIGLDTPPILNRGETCDDQCAMIRAPKTGHIKTDV